MLTSLRHDVVGSQMAVIDAPDSRLHAGIQSQHLENESEGLRSQYHAAPPAQAAAARIRRLPAKTVMNVQTITARHNPVAILCSTPGPYL